MQCLARVPDAQTPPGASARSKTSSSLLTLKLCGALPARESLAQGSPHHLAAEGFLAFISSCQQPRYSCFTSWRFPKLRANLTFVSLENLSSLHSLSLDCHAMGFPGREHGPFCTALLRAHGKPRAPAAACSLWARALGATGVSGCPAAPEHGHPAWATSRTLTCRIRRDRTCSWKCMQ